MQVRRVGEHGLLVECASAAEVAAAYTTLRATDRLEATEIVPAARSVLLDGLADVEAALGLVTALSVEPGADGRPASPGDAPAVEIPVRYDGPDLAEVARQWRVTTAEVVRIHTAAHFVVAFCGFAPGFAYCTGLPEGLGVRRRPTPRARVPAGSVALAGEFSSVYPGESPGGWQLIGRTGTQVWRPGEERPALLEPGTRVRFRDVERRGDA